MESMPRGGGSRHYSIDFQGFERKVTGVNESRLRARIAEKSIAGKPHDGICEWDAGQLVSFLNSF